MTFVENKRYRALITVVVTLGLVLASVRLGWPLPAIWLISLMLVAWVLDFDLRPQEIVRFLISPSILIAAGVVSVRAVDSDEGLLAVLLMFGVAMYVLLLTLNILNVATVRTIPLRKPALSTLFLLGMVIVFTLCWTFLSVTNSPVLTLILFWLVMTLFAYSYLSLASVEGRIQWLDVFIFSILTGEISLLINFWPAEPVVSIAALVGWAFVLLGLFHHHNEKDLRPAVVREYLLVSILLLFAYLWL